MKPHLIAITLLGSISTFGFSSNAFSEEYSVSGTVFTENITSTLQIGNIDLELTRDDGIVVFSDTGSLVGNITGTDAVGSTFLSHVARFAQGNSFTTQNDKAHLIYPYIRATVDGTPEGVPCSFFIEETISDITRGTKFFRNTTEVNITATGWVSTCPGDNENYFKLSGSIIID